MIQPNGGVAAGQRPAPAITGAAPVQTPVGAAPVLNAPTNLEFDTNISNIKKAFDV